MNNCIELHSVTKTFGEKVAIDRLDLVVPEGTIYVAGGFFIVRHNGWTAWIPWDLLPWFLVFKVLAVFPKDHLWTSCFD